MKSASVEEINGMFYYLTDWKYLKCGEVYRVFQSDDGKTVQMDIQRVSVKNMTYHAFTESDTRLLLSRHQFTK